MRQHGYLNLIKVLSASQKENVELTRSYRPLSIIGRPPLKKRYVFPSLHPIRKA